MCFNTLSRHLLKSGTHYYIKSSPTDRKARVLNLGSANLLKSKANVLFLGQAAQLSTVTSLRDIYLEAGTTTVNRTENSLLQIYTERKFSPSPLIFT